MQELGRITRELGEGIRQIVIPGERERRKAQDFVDRLQTIKTDLADLQCEVYTSGSRVGWSDTFVTHVHLRVSKSNHDRVMKLIERSGIELPDQSLEIRDRWAAIGDAIVAGLMSGEHVKEEADTTQLLLFEGTGWLYQSVSLKSNPQPAR